MSIVLTKAELYDFYHIVTYFDDCIDTINPWRKRMEEIYPKHETFCLVFKDLELKVLCDIVDFYAYRGNDPSGIGMSRNILKNLRGFV